MNSHKMWRALTGKVRSEAIIPFQYHLVHKAACAFSCLVLLMTVTVLLGVTYRTIIERDDANELITQPSTHPPPYIIVGTAVAPNRT